MGQDTVSFPDTLILDGLPHDRAYFFDHLSYLRNYYETVSNGHLVFDTTALTVFPLEEERVYRLDYPMWHYNHNVGDEQLNAGLTELFVDAVHMADSIDRIPFADYNAIIIFHAGVGKDFNLGYDTTPFDIPSAFINENDLATFPNPSRIPAGVHRGLILPEGENQQEALDLGIELSMNGIMIKLFGNWLGLPDLFNTNTGQSGVGRWGMMDQGSGNVDALVPAYPDAWSRAYLGWETPQVVVPSAAGDTVFVARHDTVGAPKIIKIPVTPREYYLVENRDADADSVKFVELTDRDGRRLRVDNEGRITRPDGTFRIAVRANNYDFGIPGSGLLIWHVDEDVINRKIDSNRVNTDPEHRGVDLVEADGSQDIGHEFGFASAGSGTELGIFEDAWYKDNEGYLAANPGVYDIKFSDKYFPSARLYDGSYTKIELSGFTDVAPIMSFIAKQTDAATGFPVSFPVSAKWTTADLFGNGRPLGIFSTNQNFHGWSRDTVFVVDTLGRVVYKQQLTTGNVVQFNPPVDVDGDGKDEVLFEGSPIGILKAEGDSFRITFSSPPGNFLSSEHVIPVKSVNGLPGIACVGRYGVGAGVERRMILFDLNMNEIYSLLLGLDDGQVAPPEAYNIDSYPTQRILFIQDHQASCISVGDTALSVAWSVSDPRIGATAVVLAEPTRRTIYLDGYGYVNAEDGSVVCLEPNCTRPNEDWNGDGFPDNGGPYGRTDIQREDFPRLATDKSWIIDMDANGTADVFGYARAESLSTSQSYTRILTAAPRGQVFTDFPRAAVIADPVRPFLWTRNPALHTMTVTEGNGRYYYSIRSLVNSYHTPRFNYSEDRAIINVGPQRPQAVAREKWVYCWPNPTSDISRIRISLPYRANVEIKIFDLAGRKVAELQGNSGSAGPLAFEIPWDVSRVESGVYIGQVSAQGSGASDKAQVKIAVVK